MLNLIRDPRRENIPERVNEFLQALPGPVAIHLTGRDSSRTRVLVTLSHGNEPSGLEAVHHWLLSGRQPNVNVVIILGAVEAALAEPMFFHRQLPGTRDHVKAGARQGIGQCCDLLGGMYRVFGPMDEMDRDRDIGKP